MAEIIVSSGAKVKINIASFGDVMRLKSTIQKVIAQKNIKLDFSLQDDIGEVAQVLLLVDSDSEVIKSIFDCLKKCTYNGEKITENTFEAIEARQDYYDIIFECIKINLSPFFKGLVSKLSGMDILAKNLNTQKPE